MKDQYKQSLLPLINRKNEILEIISPWAKELEGLNIAIKALIDIGYDEDSTIAVVNTTSDKPSTPTPKVSAYKANFKSKIPASYNTKLKYPAKIKFVLKKLGSATVNEIVEHITSIDKHVDKVKLTNGITYSASMLNTKGELLAERVGKANKYSLNTKKDDISDIL